MTRKKIHGMIWVDTANLIVSIKHKQWESAKVEVQAILIHLGLHKYFRWIKNWRKSL